MRTINLQTIGEQLKATGCYQTTWKELGLSFDEELAGEIIRLSTEDHVRPATEELVREARSNSPVCRDAARRLLGPLVNRLFDDDKYASARANWNVFGVNYYDVGNTFPMHRDFNNSDIRTALVASLSGVRILGVKGVKPIRQEVGSIVIIDGGSNPEHEAYCVEGPSVSAVEDVPELLY